MSFEIIDFHTHPFAKRENNICAHIDYCHMSAADTRRVMEGLGISRFCGSVLSLKGDKTWAEVQACNDEALRLAEYYQGAYIPGFHVNPRYPKESCAEIGRMAALGVRLIGEVVPYIDGWAESGKGAMYDSPELSEILDCAEEHRMIFSFHSCYEDEMDRMVAAHPNLVMVAAHPGEITNFNRHMERMKTSKNYYLDLSGTGLFRYGMLRHAIDLFGPERFLFGSDYPTCAPALYVGGVLLDSLLTDDEKRLVFAGNAKRLLGLS